MLDIQFSEFNLPPFSIQPSEIIHINDYELFNIPNWPTLNIFSRISNHQYEEDYQYAIELSWECFQFFKQTTNEWYMRPAISQMFYNGIIQVRQLEFHVINENLQENKITVTCSPYIMEETMLVLASTLSFLTKTPDQKFRSINLKHMTDTIKAISILLENQDYRKNTPELNKKIAFRLTLSIKNLNKILVVLYVPFL